MKTWDELMDGYGDSWSPTDEERVIANLILSVQAAEGIDGRGAQQIYEDAIALADEDKQTTETILTWLGSDEPDAAAEGATS